MTLYTRVGDHGVLWVAIGLGLWWWVRVATTVWGTLAVNYAVKRAVRRERPFVAGLVPAPSSHSFPSSHAAMSTAAAIVLSEARPELVPLWAALAGAMCLSRLYVGAHHAGDVAAGVALGAVTGGIALAVT